MTPRDSAAANPFWPRALLIALLTLPTVALAGTNDWFGVRVIDASTGRGVPLVELETTHHVRFVTDNAGWVAIAEPGWEGKETFFHWRSHGYAAPKDGFGYAGIRLTPRPGARETVRLDRVNVAERLYRMTGEGLYRDSLLLGEPTPLAEPLGSALIVGQDSSQAVPYGGRLYWFWGDTSRLSYPLGHFRTAGAQSELPGRGGLDPARGIDFRYWTNADGFSRAMCPLEPSAPGLVWIDGLVVVPDTQGRDQMVAHYSRMKSLGERLEHGLVVWNNERASFEKRTVLAPNETWRFLRGHPLRQRESAGQEFVLCGDNFPNVRVPARLEAVLDPTKYEAWSCAETASTNDPPLPPRRRPDGELDYAWRRAGEPTGPALERHWLQHGLVRTNELRFLPADIEGGKRITFHNGATRWNPHRQRWICIAVESGGTSPLGEVWYSEARQATGPWTKARKILTHDRYSFYNPVQREFFDAHGGRVIYFEGTYANTFAGNPDATPRYDYNQVMYRLDLNDPRLRPAQD